jgi:hypothetical protein
LNGLHVHEKLDHDHRLEVRVLPVIGQPLLQPLWVLILGPLIGYIQGLRGILTRGNSP